MDKEKVIEVLRNRTMKMFSDDWYSDTANEILSKNSNDSGYVYFIRYNGSDFVKIGKSYELMKRMSSFSTSTHQRIILIGYIYTENYGLLEKNMHEQLSNYRSNGEWFRLNYFLINQELKKHNGVFCNSYVDKRLSVVDGIFISGTSISRSDISNSYNELFIKLDQLLPLSVRHSKDNLLDSLNLKDSISKKKMTSILRDYATANGYLIFEGNSNGKRWFKFEL